MAFSMYNYSVMIVCIATLCLVIYSIVISDVWIYLICLGFLYKLLEEYQRITTGTIDAHDRGVYITGCDTGFGHELARRLDAAGFTVFAGCLHPAGDGASQLKETSSEKLHIVPVNVGKCDSVNTAHDYVEKHLPPRGLWAIVNNVGMAAFGDVELLSVDALQKTMNVNFYGAVRTVYTFLYLVRKTKGRVVFVSSNSGIITWPRTSPYNVAKHAIETYADALRLEMQKFGVKVCKVQPGNFSRVTGSNNPHHYVRHRQEADEIWQSASDDVRNTYTREYLEVMISNMENNKTGSAPSAKPVIDALTDAVMSESPHSNCLVYGGDGWIDRSPTMARFHGVMPTWLSDWIFTKWTHCDRFPDISASQ